MLPRNRLPGIESLPAPAKVNEDLPDSAIDVLRWLDANRVDYVLVGPVARLITGEGPATGPVAIVPAPYGRNLDRLTRALLAAKARQLLDGDYSAVTTGETIAIKLTPEKLIGPEPLALRCGNHDLHIEGRPIGVPRYQELLYEATRQQVTADLGIQVAALEDVELYDHIRRTGSPEITVKRAVRAAKAA
jgi:hypothetical protein